MFTSGGTHHHGPLAGLGAGAAAVLFAFGVLALSWHRVAGQVSMAVAALAYALMAAAFVAVCAATCFVVLWVLHRARNPHLLAGRNHQAPAPEAMTMLPGGAITGPATAAIPQAAPPLAIEPPRETHNHFHFPDAETAAAAVRAMQDQETPR